MPTLRGLHDDASRRTSITYPGGANQVTYAYDTANRLATVTDWNSNQTAYAYDDANRMTTATLPNGVVSATTYDAAGRTTAVNHTLGANTLQGFTYNLDAAGNRTEVTSSAGTESYTLDGLSRITNVSYPGGSSASYTYDHNGNRLTKTAGGTTTSYTYDAAGELTSDGTNTSTYDANGNLTARGGDSFSYDWASRMTGATVGGTATSYAYDGDGVRTGKTVGAGTPVTYLWDRESGLPLLVDDGASAYVQANGPVEDVAGAGTASYHLNDALGSTRGLADGSGAVTGTLDYDVFGATRSASGATSALTFTGQQPDAETGFTFLRSRYLDPGVGRFTTADSVQPNAPGTQGYNPFAYVANNPARWADPSGHEVSAGMLAIEGACFRTTWCGTILVEAEQRAALGGLLGIGGGEAVTFIVLACALDVTIERFADGEWHKGGCLTVAMKLYDLITGKGSSGTGPVVLPTSLPHSGGGGVNTSAGTDTGGQTAAPLPPFPPKGPGGNGYCLSDVLSWLAQVPGAVVKNAGGAEGVETWNFTSPDGHDWELKIKRQGDRVDPSRGPRISLEDKTRGKSPNVPSYYDPVTGTWGARDSPKPISGWIFRVERTQMTQIPTDLAQLYGLGPVLQFDFDVSTQTLTAGLSVIAAEGDDWHRLTATFGKVIAFDFDGEIPVVISPQCSCDAFDELSSSELLNSVALEKVWTTLSRGGRSRVITRHVPPSAFRHFRLAAGFFWAEWLCAEVEFDLAEQPEPPDPPPVKADRNPFA